MPYSAGNFSLYATGNPVVTGSTISSSWANNTLSDIASGMSSAVLKDGTQTITATIPMGGFKFSGLAAGTTNGDSVRYEQVVGAYLPITGGTLTGNLLFTDATYDIGATGATRPRDLFLSRNAVIGGTINVTGHTTFEGVTSTGATGTGKLVYDTSPIIALNTASTAATQTALDNSTKVATTAYADGNRNVLGTPTASTSGTSIDFTGIPSGVRKIIVSFVGVSTNGTAQLRVQIGGGSVENTGYLGASMGTSATSLSTANFTAGFDFNDGASSAAVRHGALILTLENASAFTWSAAGNLGQSDATRCISLGGSKSCAAVLDRVRITTTNGTDAFDAGEVNISYQY